jgi:hypothetical protein
MQHGGDEKFIHSFGHKASREENTWIKMDLKELGWEGVDWIHLAQGTNWWLALVITVLNLWVPGKVRNFLTRWATTSFSRRILLHGVDWLVMIVSTVPSCDIHSLLSQLFNIEFFNLTNVLLYVITHIHCTSKNNELWITI